MLHDRGRVYIVDLDALHNVIPWRYQHPPVGIRVAEEADDEEERKVAKGWNRNFAIIPGITLFQLSPTYRR